ncbi:MAG: SpoIIE family protein phosphatase [Planctomycetes bacterium]|nr:SpoIIE family protein phosphatase [Planctomycetota bacterium]
MNKEQSHADETRVRILVVDDEPAIRALLAHTLRTVPSYDVLEAGDGTEAQESLRGAPADLVITDLRMPRMGGLELMQWAQQEGIDASWIILSGQGTFDDATRAVHLGAFDFLTKPLSVMDSLLVSVRNAIEQRRLSHERQRLTDALAERNERLNRQVAQLKEACQLLVQQADTIGQDLHRAELIQRALLPYSVPALQGFAVDTIYRPSHNVGGDLYDVVRLDDDHLVVYIADAAGHGVSAAMLAVLFKHRIPLTAGQPPRPTPPAEALREVNRHLIKECSRPGLFVTAAYCLLNTTSGEATVASAGHPPLLLQRADGSIEHIHHTGPALGLNGQAEFAQIRVQFRNGDRLLMYTDGLYDGRVVHDALTTGPFGPILADEGLGSQSLLHALYDAAARQRNHAPQNDDITMLLLTTRAVGSTLDNGGPEAEPSARQVETAATPHVRMGSGTSGTAFSIEGRGTWIYCTGFHDACMGEIQGGRPVTVDLSLCEYLDSTFLGTIQELVDAADRAGVSFTIQGALPEVRQTFEELGMERVLAHQAREMAPLPSAMGPVETAAGDQQSRRRILYAHEALASLSQRNRDEFLRLIQGMRAELARHESQAACGRSSR